MYTPYTDVAWCVAIEIHYFCFLLPDKSDFFVFFKATVVLVFQTVRLSVKNCACTKDNEMDPVI